MIKLFCNHKYTLSIFLPILLVFGIQITSYGDVTLVTDRTSQVRDAIVTAAGVNTADEVTETHLAAITSLNLRDVGISELQSGDFSGLTGLTNLNLYDNQLSSLPDGIFEGLTALTHLRLGGNAVDPLSIAVSLEKVEDGQFKVVAPTGAPYDIVVPISATNGSIADNTTSFTIAKGSTSSDALTVTRTAGTTTAVTANIGTLPNLPTNHYGYVLTKSDAVPLEVISAVPDTTPVDPTPIDPVDPVNPIEPETPTNTAPTFTDGTTTIRSIAENTVANTNIGSAVSATDANNDTLTYSLSGTDAASFDIDSTTGQLKTKVALDYETKQIYIITTTASDGTLTDTITVIVSIIDVADTSIGTTTLPVSDRTPEVRDAIVAAVPNITAAADVTNTHLATITSLNLRNADTAALRTGDFGGLTALTSLNLYGNRLNSLPVRIFEGLTSLTSLRLGGNAVDPMPFAVSLQQVDINQFKAIIPTGAPFDVVLPINGTSITAVTIPKGSIESAAFTALSTPSIGALPGLPVNHFGYILTKSDVCNRTQEITDAIAEAVPGIDNCQNVTEVHIATITSLDLSNKSITSLQVDDFSGLLSLSTLNLSNNQLDSLPDGIFEVLTSLTTLNLSGNSVDPLPIVVSLQKVGINQVKAVVPTGAPFDINLPITIANGSIGNGVTAITIPAASMESQPLTVIRTANTFAAVTVAISSLPTLPSNHTGYALTKSSQLPVEIFSSTNAAPVFTEGSSTIRTIAENTATGTNIGTPISATDANNDTLTYGLGGINAAVFDIDDTTGQLKTRTALDYETKSTYSVTIAVSDGELEDSIDVTINITDINEVDNAVDVKDDIINKVPVFSEGETATRSIAENTGSGVDIGTAVTATDADGDTLIYTLIGTDAAKFSIDSSSGQLRTRAALDYELKTSYSVTITVSDGNGGSDSITVTITITDVDERPANIAPEFTDGTSTTRAIAENTGSGVDIGTPIAATDADADTLTYTLGGTDAASFNINSTNGQLRTSASLDYETKSSYTLTVSVSDGNGGSDSITVTITITDVDERSTNIAPEFTDGSSTTRAIAENTGSGVDIGTAVAATDADADTLAYSLGGTDAAAFSINSTNGQLRTSAALDYETESSYTLTVSVSDGNGGSDSITVTITITDVDETPTNNPPVFTEEEPSRTIAENTNANVDIDSPVTATDEDNQTLIYSLTGSDADSFDIESTTGQLKTKAPLNHEVKSSYTVTVNVSDGQGGSDSVDVTIDVTDVNEAPVFTDGSSTTRTIAENAGANINIGSAVSATDVDANTSLTYSLGGTNAASFDIEPTTGQLKTKAALDYETKNSYSVIITVSDSSLTDTITVTINIRDLDETPSNIAPIFTDGETAIRSIPENTATDTDIGIPIAATDEDSTTLAYLLSGTDASTFSIDEETGQLKTSAALNYEDKTSYSLTVTVSDGSLDDEITVTINVTNVNEAPIFADGESTTRRVTENTVAGENFGRLVSATDPDTADTLTYSLEGTDAASFDIEPTTGQLKTKAALDFETKESYSVTVKVTDSGAHSDTIAVTINVRDVDENSAPVFTDGETATRAVAENTGAGVDIGTPVAATDADNDTLEYTLGGTDSASFSIDSTSGQLRTNAPLDYETKHSYEVTITVSDGNNGSDTITITINVTDVQENRAPVFTDGTDTTRSVAENTGSGVDIGTAVSATDADNDTLEYTLSGTDAAAFSIDSTSGQLRTKDALDYEDTQSYTVAITVSDEDNVSDSISVTINVTDANDAPQFTQTGPITHLIAENSAANVNIGSPMAATDEDNDDLNYGLGGTDASKFDIDTANGQLKTKDILNYEDDTSHTMTITVSDDNGGEDTIMVTINVTDANDTPAFTDGATDTRSIAENTAANVDIGNPISATDEDNDTLEYSLSGTDASSFSIVSTSGQLKTKAALDYEDDDAYTVTVTVTDDSGTSNNSASIDVTIDVTDVFENSAPTFTVESFAYEIDDIEAASVGDNIGDALTASDTDNDTLTYSVGGDDASKFAVDSSAQLTVTQALLDDTRTNYSIKVIADDGNGGMAEVSGTVRASGRVARQLSNNSPVFDDGTSTTRAIPENTASGENIGDAVSATDADTSDTLTYTLEGTDTASFSIVSTSGQLQTSASLDYETKTTYSVTVKVTDDSGETNASATIAVTINVTDVDEGTMMTPVSERTAQIRNAIVAAVPGVTSAADVTADHLAAITSLNASNTNLESVKSGDFDGLTGLTTLDLHSNYLAPLPAGIFDDLTELTHLDLGSNGMRTLTAGVFDPLTKLTYLDLYLNHMPTLPDGIFSELTALETLYLNFNRLHYLPDGIFVGLSNLTDLWLRTNPIDPIPFTVTLEKVEAGKLKVKIPYGAPFDVVVPLSVTNGSVSGETTSFTIPTGSSESEIATVTRTIGITLPVTVNVGTLPGIPSAHNGYAFVKSNDLPLTVIDAADSHVNSAPVFTDGTSTTRSIPENTRSGVNIGTALSATDADNVDTLTYSLGGTDAASFNIVNTTGQLRTKSALNIEDKSSYSVTVSVSDGNNGTDSISVTINVTDANDAPVFSETGPTTRAVDENTDTGENIGPPVSATDEDSGDTLEYTLGGTDAAAFSIDDGTGQLKTMSALNHEVKSSYSLTITVSDGNSTQDTITVNISVTDVNDAPVFSGGATTTRAVDENTATNVNIGTPVSATDEDGDTLEYSFGGTDAAAFSFDSTRRRLKTKNALDYETTPSYSVTITATDDSGASNASTTISVTININNLYEGDYPVSERTRQIRNAIIAAVPGVDAAKYVTAELLAAITSLNASDTNLDSVKSSDFDGLTGLTTLDLHSNYLDPLPAGIFDDLTELTYLDLGSNGMRTLTAGVFDPLTKLTYLDLYLNYLSTLPDGIFSQLTALETLHLNYNGLHSLPDGIFVGLSEITELWLHTNPIDPIPFTVTLEKVEAGELKVKIPIGAPFDVVVPLSVTNGSVSGETTSFTIPTGSAESNIATVTRTTGTTAAVTVNVGTLPGIPSNHYGYALVKSSDLPLTVLDAVDLHVNSAPVFTDGTSTTRSIPENTRSGVNIGTVLSATDADNVDTLTYSLGGTDAASFNIVNTTGQLRTKSTLNFEDKSSYSVTVSVSDGNNGTDSISVTINVTDANDAPVFSETGPTTRAVDENTATGENIGPPVSATDEDSGDTLEYTLGGTDAAAFSIDDGTGQLKTMSALNFEVKSSYSLTITVSDGNSKQDTITVNISVTDVNDAPVFSGGATTTRAVDENTATNVNIGTPVSATDEDGDTLEYSFGGTDAAAFSFDSTRRRLKTKNALDYETTPSYSVTITATDDSGASNASTTISVTININNLYEGDYPVSERTRQIRNAIIAAVPGVDAAKYVTAELLAAITSLNASDTNLDSVKSGDFDGLTGLTTLDLHSNYLDPLPAGIFDDLTELTYLDLGSNGMRTLTAGVFDPLTKLTYLDLYLNYLSTLPDGIFSQLTALETLHLNYNGLHSLPDGIFVGLSEITELWLHTNPIDPIPFTVTLEKVEAGELKVKIPVGAPFDVVVPLSVTNGSVSGETTSFTIPTGSSESNIATVTRTTGTTAAVTVNVGALPGIPSDHYGYAFVKSSDLPLTVIDAVGGAPNNVSQLPKATAFLPNYPNPFNPETWIPYQLHKPADVTLTIYDLRGVVVRELTLGHQPPGYYTNRTRAAHWDGRNNIGERVATGVYFCTIKAGNFAATRKMLIRK